MTRPRPFAGRGACAMLGLSGLVLAGCHAAPRPPAQVAAQAACRAEVDRVYAAQNRVDLSRRDFSDTPFAGSYVSGVTTRGLSSQFARDQMTQSCLNNADQGAAVAAPGTGPVFSPAAPRM